MEPVGNGNEFCGTLYAELLVPEAERHKLKRFIAH